ncbi:S-layer homology domain-containing protein [Intestinimonas sp. MSJ-38]|uniref:S-layer homology domain-containing protein n=1 Tax=Intestinimonas sp. MSJ-38 TaxID=2841532 RepID=UPI001C0F4EE3|nr:S-layer homology domain-containing protein [Intestinimonas sp. MSJ-38]MBU5433363.1 S-layer homology domain-containing protein [Intestinimonas sp. MSJ-38]
MTKQKNGKRIIALLLTLVMCVGMLPTAFAAQQNSYHDPAEHWLTASNRTNELDVNAVVTHETFNCGVCNKQTSFTAWRVPEYTRDGKTALTRNVLYSDGTMVGGEGKGSILDGTPGQNAYYTGYHWTKAMCDTCGTMNSNGSINGYGFGRNVYNLYDCAPEFMEELDKTVSYEYTDATYHTITTKGGSYCCFCYGTIYDTSSKLERHNMVTEVLPQPANGRFATVEKCSLCDYARYDYTAAKAVIADYYGVVDGKPHTITVSDLSESGVRTSIRYGNSADSCTMTSAPNYTEEGQYMIYYEITYTYKGKEMTENGVAKVWLRDETAKDDGSCACGCGDPNCGYQDKNCGGNCCTDKGCGKAHHFTLLDSVKAGCTSLGYDRYLCTDCGKIEKRDYVDSLGHAWQSIVIRDATCETDGKLLELCSRCGQMKQTATPKGEHTYETYTVAATCTSPGYTVRECSVCGDRHIEDITSVLPHNYESHVIAATCENGGKTIHRCDGCGSSFVTDYTDSLGHSWDKGTLVTNATCTGEGVMEYRCTRCGYHRIEGNDAAGHVPGDAATCTQPQLCTKCGAVLKNALGHDYKSEVTAPTCTEMGYTTNTCTRCGDTTKTDYTEPVGHKPGDWIIDKEPTTDSEGSKHKECENCGEKLETAEIEKIYNSGTTDSKGEAVVGGYLVTVTDTDTKNPVANATVALHKDNAISLRLPNSRLLDYADQTTVTVQLVKDKSAVPEMSIAVTDKNDNYASGKTDKAGQITVPTGSGMTGEDGKTTIGYEDADGERWTLTVKVIRTDTKRPISGCEVSIGKTGNITVKLPDGTDLDAKHQVTVIVTDHKKSPQQGKNVTVKGDLNQTEKGKTDKNGELTVPAVEQTERHGVYIVGYTDGTFGPSRSMTRAEAAAIFARLLAEKNGDTISTAANTKFTDIPAHAWYSGYVKYLANNGVTYGKSKTVFAPNDAITRAEFTTMAVRFFDVYGSGDAEIMEQFGGFNDVSSGYWAAEYIKYAALHGWINGYGDGSFHADREINRAEVVTIVNRLLGREADEDYIADNLRRLNTFPDVSRKHWAYYAVMEAANAHTAVLGESESWSK